MACSQTIYAPERARPAQLGIGLRAMPAQMKPKAGATGGHSVEPIRLPAGKRSNLLAQDGAQNPALKVRMAASTAFMVAVPSTMTAYTPNTANGSRCATATPTVDGERVTGDDGG